MLRAVSTASIQPNSLARLAIDPSGWVAEQASRMSIHPDSRVIDSADTLQNPPSRGLWESDAQYSGHIPSPLRSTHPTERDADLSSS
jgi:hypothetical protein